MEKCMENQAVPVILTGILSKRALQDQIIIMAGVGRGIGYETARSLAWLGARLILIENEIGRGRESAIRINQEVRADCALLTNTDTSDEKSVVHLARQVFRKFGRVDGIINSTTAMLGSSLMEGSIGDWDKLYRTSLRGPAIMARVFLPAMLQQDAGVFLTIATLDPHLHSGGIYACYRSAQKEMASILDHELEESGVITFTLHPGRLHYSNAPEKPFLLSFEDELTPELTGAGCAAAVALAPRFRGLEISAQQALIAGGIQPTVAVDSFRLTGRPEAKGLCTVLYGALQRQTNLWSARSQIERQWLYRYFRQSIGLDVDECHYRVKNLKAQLEQDVLLHACVYGHLFERLAQYYRNAAQKAGEKSDAFGHGASVDELVIWAETAARLGQILSEAVRI
jgi:NAD(P)-dependent dehydrogenase (short-subunit alcohol dehydrogenase family)